MKKNDTICDMKIDTWFAVAVMTLSLSVSSLLSSDNIAYDSGLCFVNNAARST